MIVAAAASFVALHLAALDITAAVAAAPVDAKGPLEETAKELQPRSVRASSFLKNGWNAAEENYLPMYVADDNPKTAWVEGASHNGEGEWLEWIGPRLEKARKYVVYVRNGYQKSASLYKANSRASRMSVELVVDGKPLAGVAPLDVTFADGDKAGWQRFEIPVAGAPRAVAGLRFTLRDVAPGKTYTDACVSDVRVFVEGDDRYSAASEAFAQEEVRRFVAERALAAKQLNAKSRKGQPLPRIERSVAAAALLADAPALPKLSVPAPTLGALDGWRRVGADVPPGARAMADAIAQERAPPGIELLYPFLRRDAVAFFDEPDRFTALEQQIAASEAKETAERNKFIARCERERKKDKTRSREDDEFCTCEYEFYGCGGDGYDGGTTGTLKRRLLTSRVSGVFIPAEASLLNPTQVLVVEASWWGERDPHVVRSSCLLDYSSKQVAAACDFVHFDDHERRPVHTDTAAYRVKLDGKGNLAALFGGSAGKKPEVVWAPVVEVADASAAPP